MTSSFSPDGAFIPVTVQVSGRGRLASVVFALDTGATMTWLRRETFTELDYDLTSPAGFMEVTTASGREVTPVISVDRIRALDLERIDFPVISQNLPSGTPFDGLLGLDFFRQPKTHYRLSRRTDYPGLTRNYCRRTYDPSRKNEQPGHRNRL